MEMMSFIGIWFINKREIREEERGTSDSLIVSHPPQASSLTFFNLFDSFLLLLLPSFDFLFKSRRFM